MTEAAVKSTYLKVQKIIAEMTGNDVEDIGLHSHLEEELGVTPTDLTQIVREINKQFELTLNPKQLLEEIETVNDLVVLVHDETELG